MSRCSVKWFKRFNFPISPLIADIAGFLYLLAKVDAAHEDLSGPAIGRIRSRNGKCPDLNCYRPCGFATVTISESGKRRRTYLHDDYRTPFEKLASLTRWTRYLRPGITAKFLRQFATRHSDTEAATLMRDAKIVLLNQAGSPRETVDTPHVSPLPGWASGLKYRPPPPLQQSNRREKSAA